MNNILFPFSVNLPLRKRAHLFYSSADEFKNNSIKTIPLYKFSEINILDRIQGSLNS